MPGAAPADSKSMAVKRHWWMSFMGESRIKNQEKRREEEAADASAFLRGASVPRAAFFSMFD
jgi:hypothetical protein